MTNTDAMREASRKQFEDEYCPDPELKSLFLETDQYGEYAQAIARLCFIWWQKGRAVPVVLPNIYWAENCGDSVYISDEVKAALIAQGLVVAE